ncbi:MAG: hypothetical protein MK171_08955 [Pirellulales bacterium]|nr:hypothetical protein [Pirellulales bacterium]
MADQQPNKCYSQDCQARTTPIIEILQNYQEACADLRNFHEAEISNRMNKIMEVLTVIATMSIPLSFIADI